MRTLLPAVLWFGCAMTSSLSAQWYVRADLATARYGGTAHDTSGSHTTPEGGPVGGPGIAVGAERRWLHAGLAVRVGYANPGFAVRGSGLNITDKTTGTLIEASTLVSTRVGGIGPSGAVWVEVGPALHLWDYSGEMRTRIGGIAAASYEWPVTRRLLGSVRLDGMLSPSWFEASDLPPEFERRVTWRYGVGLGLHWRL
ncbi:MAG: hypothetical protein ABR537_09340 [Gemmatimonadales bacterium]